MFDRRQRLKDASLYLVCGDHPDAFLQAALRGGVDIVQLRIKDGDERTVLSAGHRFARVCRLYGALFILNDRPDLVRAAGADGVHVGQDDVDVTQARKLVGPQRLVGLSTHTPEQIERANASDVDYIGVGPVHETPTKPGRQAVGLELVSYAAEHARAPFFAIGGIDPGNLGAVLDAGARRIAAVRALTQAVDPERAAGRLAAALTALAAERERIGST